MKQLLATLAILSVLMVGCQSSVGSFKTLKQVGDLVDTTMQAYADAVVAGKVSEPDQNKVRDAYGKYRVAFHASVDAARLDLSQSPPEQVVATALSFVNLVTTLTQ